MEPMPRADGGSERVQTGRSVSESQHHVAEGVERQFSQGHRRVKHRGKDGSFLC